MRVRLGTAAEFGFKVRKSDQEETVIGYDQAEQVLFIDRADPGAADFPNLPVQAWRAADASRQQGEDPGICGLVFGRGVRERRGGSYNGLDFPGCFQSRRRGLCR